MIHVIIAVHNRLNLTLNCLDSLKRQKNFNELNIIIVDDGSTDGSSEYLKKNFSNLTILKGTGFLFSAGCFNYAIEYVLKIHNPKDWILLVSNDSELSPNTILELVKISKNNSRKVIAGALTINLKDKETIIRSGTIVKSWFFNKTEHIYEGIKLSEISSKIPVEVDFIPGRCLLHPIEMFRKVGNYDSKLFSHYGNDEEFSIRSKKLGYSPLLCPSSIVYVRPNDAIVPVKISIKYFCFVFFSKRSSANILDKFKLTLKIVPFYAKITFFTIGIIKSLYFFVKNSKDL